MLEHKNHVFKNAIYLKKKKKEKKKAYTRTRAQGLTRSPARVLAPGFVEFSHKTPCLLSK